MSVCITWFLIFSVDQYHRILSENSDVNSIGGTSYKTPVSPSNITSYIQNLRQYIPKMSHMMSHDEDEEDMKQEMKGKDEIGDWIEEKIRKESHKQSWDEQSTKVCTCNDRHNVYYYLSENSGTTWLIPVSLGLLYMYHWAYTSTTWLILVPLGLLYMYHWAYTSTT